MAAGIDPDARHEAFDQRQLEEHAVYGWALLILAQLRRTVTA